MSGAKEEAEVICAICSSFEPHTWRKKVCRNCFHSEEEHTENNTETPSNEDTKNKVSEKSKVDEKGKNVKSPKDDKNILKKSSENLKDIDSKTKGKPPDTLPKGKKVDPPQQKSSPVSISQRFKDNISQKQKFGTESKISDAVTSKKSITNDSTNNEVKGKVSSSLTSSTLASKSQKHTTEDTSASKDSAVTIGTKSGHKPESVNTKQIPTTTKVFTNSKLAGSPLLPLDKASSASTSIDKKKQTLAEKQKQENKFTGEVGKHSDAAQAAQKGKANKPDSGESSAPSAPSKVKQFAKAFIPPSTSDTTEETKFNSLGRKKTKDTSSISPLSQAESKAGVKCAATSVQNVSQKTSGNAATGTQGDKAASSGISSVNKFGGSGASPSSKNVAGKHGLDNKFKIFEKGGKSGSGKAAEGTLAFLNSEKSKVDDDVDLIKKKLSEMEEKCRSLEGENKKLKSGITEKEKNESKFNMQKSDVENAIKELKGQLSSMGDRCNKLETDNESLIGKLKEQQHYQEERQKNTTNETISAAISEMQGKVKEEEEVCEELRDENDLLRQEINDLKVEMDEMYDSFRDQEAEEFRDLQRELEITAKNCRILQFKLRKAERRNEQVEGDRIHYEEKLRMLQDQFDDNDARSHIRAIEQELQMAKEVSVRLHDELDIMEERRAKVEDENRHLTDILEKSDKKQFRLEMEIDKLKDQIVDLRAQLTKSDGGSSGEEVTDRRVLLGRIGKQSSQELDSSQLMKDLYDSMERETDLKDQLKFLEEESKSMRKKAEELEEENENLSVQLKKMSFAQATRPTRLTSDGEESSEMTEAEVELKVQLELNEQEMHVTKKKVHDLEKENEKLQGEIEQLKKDLDEKDNHLSVQPEPPSPNSYYEDKMKEMQAETDDMRWKLIEKEREIERLDAKCVLHTRQTKLRKSRSLDSDTHHQLIDLKKQLDGTNQENIAIKGQILDLKKRLEAVTMENCKLKTQVNNDDVITSNTVTPNTESADVVNLRAKITELEEEKYMLLQKIGTDSVSNTSSQQLSSGIESSSHSDGAHGVSRDPSHAGVSTKRDDKPQIEFEATNRYLRSRLLDLEGENKQLKEQLEKTREEVNLLVNKNNETASPAAKQTPPPAAVSVDIESREALMDQILDNEEEIESLTESLKTKDAELNYLYDELKRIRDQGHDLKEQFSKKEQDLLQELDIAQDKNDILSNLLDIVKDRADAAESEIEKFNARGSTASSRSARTVSVLSDTSTGSDEVFDGGSGERSIPGSPETSNRVVITKDWENQFKKRIDCLERLLAEERKKLASTEKKLALVSTETLSTAMSDDAKLHEREKELLQAELVEEKKHMKIATDQIKCLREKVLSLEEENQSLQMCKYQMENDESDGEDRTPSGSIDTVIERSDGSFSSGNDRCSKLKTPSESEAEIISLSNECEIKQTKIQELEQELEQVKNVWQEKISNTEKEKEEIENEVQKLTNNCTALKDAMDKIREETIQKQKLLKDRENMINEKVSVINRKDEIIQEQEDIIKQREEDMQSLLDQISQRDDDLRDLRESLRNRDERLLEKDSVIENVNSSASEKDEELKYYKDEMSSMQNKIKDKEDTISDLETKISDFSKQTVSDIKTENIRLKADLESMASNIGTLHTNNSALESDLDKAKQALSEAMVLWNKDRSVFESELNISNQKLFMYENTDKKNESQVVATLRKETHRLLEQKEKIAGEFRVNRIESDANIRTLKNEKIRLQEELTQKIRQLTAEMTSNDKMSQELDRLRGQEEIAYQIQHHEKVLRAEYLAMKVRYETRLENLQRDHMKLLSTLDSLQREKVLDKEIIRGVQKGMSTMKETYSNDLTKWNEEKGILERHIKEIEEGRRLAKDLENKIDDLKCQLADQEYERAEIINKMTTERSGWDVEKANQQSRINQLQERLIIVTQAQTRTKDMQSRMEVAWSEERSEQKRLLAEAHGLALDLQSQLKARDNEYARERRALLEQLKRLRTEIDEEQLSRDGRLKEIEDRTKTIVHLERRLKDTEERAVKDAESSLKDRAELVKRLGEMRKQHKRDQRRIEDVLSGLTRLRELGSIVVDSEKADGSSDSELVTRLEKLSSDPLPEFEMDSFEPINGDGRKAVRRQIDEVVMKNIKESLKEIHFAVEDIARPRDITDDDKKKLRRSLSSSEIDFLKEEFLVGRQRDSFGKQKRDSRESPKASPITVRPEMTVTPKYHRSITQNGDLIPEKPLDSHMLPEIQTGSLPVRQKRIMAEVQKEQGVTTKFPDPPPSFLLPRCHHSTNYTLSQSTSSVVTSSNTQTTTSPAYASLIGLSAPLASSNERTTPSVKPQTISLNTSFSGDSLHSPSSVSTLSGAATPTSDGSIPIPIHHFTTCDTSSPLSLSSSPSPLSGSSERFTPRTARKRFFEDFSESTNGSKLWTGRSSSLEALANKHVDMRAPIDPDIIRHEAERRRHEEDLIKKDIEDTKPRAIVQSVSVEDKMLHSVMSSPLNQSLPSSSDEGAKSSQKQSKPDKPKRKVTLHRAKSVDSSVKNSVAKAGLSALPPGAPSTMKPGDIFASMKRKIKTTLRRSGSMTDEEKVASKYSCSDASGSETDGAVSHESVVIPPPTPPISTMSRRGLPEMKDDITDGKKKSTAKQPSTKAQKRMRSKSAERAPIGASALKRTTILEEDLIPDPSKSFSETSV